MNSSRTENFAKLACAYAGVVWGVFWIPLRGLDDIGITGAWATVVFYLIPTLLLLPIAFWRRRQILAGGLRLQVTGFVAGLCMILYADALIHTEVVRAMLLFYLTPVWSSLLARIWLHEPISGARIFSIILGFCGMLVIFGADVGIPWPQNVGDWMGLAAGVVWAVTAVLLRQDKQNKAPEFTMVHFFWGSVAAIVIALLMGSENVAAPSVETVTSVLPWLLPVLMVVVIPASFAVFWGAPLLSPGIVGILFMTEITVGSVTAALWAGEPFGLREIIGVVLITFAGLTESIPWPFGKARKQCAAN
jgi:drug/metabolite transporter (DMT)-like permease